MKRHYLTQIIGKYFFKLGVYYLLFRYQKLNIRFKLFFNIYVTFAFSIRKTFKQTNHIKHV